MGVGIGILGAANIAYKNTRAIGLAENAEVVAVGSRDQAKAAALLERWGMQSSATAYGSYEEVLADPRVDAVYIPLPSALHLPWVQRAAAAGKHILLEKPVAIDEEQLDGVLEACSKAGVQLMDGTMWMHNPRASHMEAVLHDASAVGQLRDVTSSFCFNGSPDFMATNVRVRNDLDPLGALGDLGWYSIRAILWAYDWQAPTAVAAHAGAAFSEDGVPLHLGATLLFPGGRRGNFECGVDRALVQELRVSGTLGTVHLDDFVIPRSEKQSSFLATSEHKLEFYDCWDATRRDEVVVHLSKPQEVAMWETFCSLVEGIKAGGQPSPHWPRIMELTQRVLFAVLQSAREGCREVQLSL